MTHESTRRAAAFGRFFEHAYKNLDQLIEGYHDDRRIVPALPPIDWVSDISDIIGYLSRDCLNASPRETSHAKPHLAFEMSAPSIALWFALRAFFHEHRTTLVPVPGHRQTLRVLEDWLERAGMTQGINIASDAPSSDAIPISWASNNGAGLVPSPIAFVLHDTSSDRQVRPLLESLCLKPRWFRAHRLLANTDTFPLERLQDLFPRGELNAATQTFASNGHETKLAIQSFHSLEDAVKHTRGTSHHCLITDSEEVANRYANRLGAFALLGVNGLDSAKFQIYQMQRKVELPWLASVESYGSEVEMHTLKRLHRRRTQG